eukprot:164632-Rhodomonas_salina.1
MASRPVCSYLAMHFLVRSMCIEYFFISSLNCGMLFTTSDSAFRSLSSFPPCTPPAPLSPARAPADSPRSTAGEACARAGGRVAGDL